MTDIVERLRHPVGIVTARAGDLYNEAADEIERLRADYYVLADALHWIAKSLNAHPAIMVMCAQEALLLVQKKQP